MTDNTELKRLAEAATAGPWSMCGEADGSQGFEIIQDIWNEHGTHTGKDVVVYEWSDESDPLGVIHRADAEFIAAANPVAVLALIADLDEARNGMKHSCAIRLKKEIERLKAELDCPFRLARHSKRLVEQLRAQAEQYDQALIKMAAERDQLRAELATERQRRWDGNESAALERDEDVRKLRAEIAGLKTGNEAYEQVNAEMKAEVEVLRKDADRAAYWKQRAKSAEGHLFSGDFRAAAMELHKYSRFESTPWPELTGSQHALISSAAGAVIATVNRLRDARRPKNRDETDAIIWCACGDGHAANSYGAGFMDANNGVCANCGAALGQGEQS